MEVIVHNADFEISGLKNIGKIFDEIENNGYIILRVIADDKEISYYSNEEIANIKPIEKLEIVVQNKKELTNESLVEAQKYIPKLIDGINSIITKFNEGLESQGYQMLGDCIEGFQWINVMIINLDNSNDYSTGDNLKKIIKNWNENLKEFLSALENKDLVLVTDILEYELVPILEEYLDIINEIKR